MTIADTLSALPDGTVVEFLHVPRDTEPLAGYSTDIDKRCHHDHWSYGAWRVLEDVE